MTTETRQLDTTELEQRVRRMYEEVALEPDREFHYPRPSAWQAEGGGGRRQTTCKCVVSRGCTTRRVSGISRRFTDV
jgi:hypothetical protein